MTTILIPAGADIAEVPQDLLPRHTFHAYFKVRDADGDEWVTHIVWAARIYSACPRCSHPVGRYPVCPVVLDPDTGPVGQLRELDQGCRGCDMWLPVRWAEVNLGEDHAAFYEDLGTEEIILAAHRLADQREQECQEHGVSEADEDA